MSNCRLSRPPQHQEPVHACQVLLADHPKGLMKPRDESSCSKRLRRSRSLAELPWRISPAGSLRSPPLLLAHGYGESLGVRSLGQAREQGGHGARTYSAADFARMAGESRLVVAARHWRRLDRQVVAHQRDTMVPGLSWKEVPGVALNGGKNRSAEHELHAPFVANDQRKGEEPDNRVPRSSGTPWVRAAIRIGSTWRREPRHGACTVEGY